MIKYEKVERESFLKFLFCRGTMCGCMISVVLFVFLKTEGTVMKINHGACHSGFDLNVVQAAVALDWFNLSSRIMDFCTSKSEWHGPIIGCAADVSIAAARFLDSGLPSDSDYFLVGCYDQAAVILQVDPFCSQEFCDSTGRRRRTMAMFPDPFEGNGSIQELFFHARQLFCSARYNRPIDWYSHGRMSVTRIQ
jgi:hypothetical protein